eukprot:6188524-Pleurochrysis_carterae.AAC.1
MSTTSSCVSRRSVWLSESCTPAMSSSAAAVSSSTPGKSDAMVPTIGGSGGGGGGGGGDGGDDGDGAVGGSVGATEDCARRRADAGGAGVVVGGAVGGAVGGVSGGIVALYEVFVVVEFASTSPSMRLLTSSVVWSTVSVTVFTTSVTLAPLMPSRTSPTTSVTLMSEMASEMSPKISVRLRSTSTPPMASTSTLKLRARSVEGGGLRQGREG